MTADDGAQEWQITIVGSGVDTSLSKTISSVPDSYQKWLVVLEDVTLVDDRQVEDIEKFTLKWSTEALLIDSEFEPLDAHKIISDPDAKTLQLVIEECDVLREGERSKREVATDARPDGAIPIHSFSIKPAAPENFPIHTIKQEANEGKSDTSFKSTQASIKSNTSFKSSLQVNVDTQVDKQANRSKNNTLRGIVMVIVVAVIGVAVAKLKVGGPKRSLGSLESPLHFECGMVGSISEGGACRCMKGLTMQKENAEEGTMACYANAASLFTEGPEKLWNFQKKQLKCCIVKGDPAATRLQDILGEIPPSDRLMVFDKFGCGSLFGKNHENGPKRHTECLISIDSLMDAIGKGFQETMKLLNLEIETPS